MGVKQSERIQVIDRLKSIFETDYRVSELLGVGDNYPLRWRRAGFIPEAHALAVEELHAVYNGQPITAYDVLLEARDAREARIRAADEAMREAG